MSPFSFSDTQLMMFDGSSSVLNSICLLLCSDCFGSTFIGHILPLTNDETMLFMEKMREKIRIRSLSSDFLECDPHLLNLKLVILKAPTFF